MIDFSIWVDADSCPTPVRDIVIRFCKRLNLELIYVANHTIPMPKSKLFKMIICDATPDAADNYVIENAKKNDIVITRDIPMASRLLEKEITTINDRGLLFTTENIKEKLSLRNFNKELYENGIVSEKTSTFSKKDVSNFANCFDREIQKKLRLFVR